MLVHMQGFVEFRIGDQPLHLDEAFGMIFSWDNVVADTRVMQRRAWQTVAKAEGLPWPAIERNFYDVRPERVITEVCHQE